MNFLAHSLLRTLKGKQAAVGCAKIGLSLALLLTGYYSTQLTSLLSYLHALETPTVATVQTYNQFSANVATGQAQGATPVEPPFLEIIPQQNGTALTISSDLADKHQTGLFTNIDSSQQTESGPTNIKGSYTLTYSDTEQSYLSTVIGYTPQLQVSGNVNVTTTTGLNTSKIEFNRTFMAATASNTLILSPDGLLKISLPNTETLPFDTYVAVTDNPAAPGSAPLGHQLVGKSYSVRAPKAVPTTKKSMALQIFYKAEDLNGIDPHRLAIFAWNAGASGWQEQPGSLLVAESMFEAPNVRLGNVTTFTVYSLMTTPSWHDGFIDETGLDAARLTNLHVTVRNNLPVLALASTAGAGVATSILITLPAEVTQWGALYYSATLNAPTATLTVDVLNSQGDVLLRDVANGGSLATIDAQTDRSIRLEVHMTATLTNTTPTLAAWKVTWQPPQPMTLRPGDARGDLGKTVTVPIVLLNPPMKAVGGATVDVEYDPAVLHASGCRVDPLGRFAASFCNEAFEADGINPDSVRFNLLANQVITGEPTLALITFTVVSRVAGATNLAVKNARVLDNDGGLLAVVQQKGAVNMAPGSFGDVNCDGVVDTGDAGFILQYSVGLKQAANTCTPHQETLFLPQCDLNGDGACDLGDALKILR